MALIPVAVVGGVGLYVDTDDQNGLTVVNGGVSRRMLMSSWTRDNLINGFEANTFFTYQPQESGSCAWIHGSREFPNIGSPLHNHAMTFGWNLTPGVGTSYVAGQASFGLGFEWKYQPDGGTTDLCEHHLYFNTNSGAGGTKRPMTVLMHRVTGNVEYAISADTIEFANGAGQPAMTIQPVNPATGGGAISLGGYVAADRCYIRQNSNNSSWVLQANAAGDNSIDLIKANNSNHVVVAPNGEPGKFGGNVGFNNVTPIAKPTISGSRGGNAALASLLTQLANYGLITDGTTA